MKRIFQVGAARGFVPLSILMLLASGCHTVRYSSNRSAGVDRLRQYNSEQGSLYWSHFDASTRASIIHVDSTGKVRVLSEVPPDVALNKLSTIVADTKIPVGAGAEATANLKLETARTVAELGKRTAAVNILRDAMYRLAEINNNAADQTQPMSSDMKELLMKVISTAEQIAIKENEMDRTRNEAAAEESRAKQLAEIRSLVNTLRTAGEPIDNSLLEKLLDRE